MHMATSLSLPRQLRDLRFPRRCRENSQAGDLCFRSSNTFVSDYLPIPSSLYELQKNLGSERGCHEWSHALSVEEYLAKTEEAHARHRLVGFRKRDPLHFVEVGTSNYNSLAQSAFSDTDVTSSGYLTNEAYGVIADALRSSHRWRCRGISVEAIPENLHALPVHDRLEKIEAVVGGSPLTEKQLLEVEELRALNRKFEVCTWRAEVKRKQVLETGECWKAKASSVSDEALNDPQFVEWKYWRDKEKLRWKAWWQGQIVPVAEENRSWASFWGSESGCDVTPRGSLGTRTSLSSSGKTLRCEENQWSRCQSTKACDGSYPSASYPYRDLSHEKAIWQHLEQLKRCSGKSEDGTIASGRSSWFYFVPEMHDLQRGYSWQRYCPHHNAITPCASCQYAGERAVACSSLGQPSKHLCGVLHSCQVLHLYTRKVVAVQHLSSMLLERHEWRLDLLKLDLEGNDVFAVKELVENYFMHLGLCSLPHTLIYETRQTDWVQSDWLNEMLEQKFGYVIVNQVRMWDRDVSNVQDVVLMLPARTRRMQERLQQAVVGDERPVRLKKQHNNKI